MGALSWLTGVGVPTLAGIGLLVAAAFAWFRLPVLGKYFGLGLACVGVAMIANARGFADARVMCNEASVRAELAQVKRDLANLQGAAARAEELSGKLTDAERKNDELARKITGACLLDERDADGLRRIR